MPCGRSTGWGRHPRRGRYWEPLCSRCAGNIIYILSSYVCSLCVPIYTGNHRIRAVQATLNIIYVKKIAYTYMCIYMCVYIYIYIYIYMYIYIYTHTHTHTYTYTYTHTHTHTHIWLPPEVFIGKVKKVSIFSTPYSVLYIQFSVHYNFL